VLELGLKNKNARAGKNCPAWFITKVFF